ncbi:U32 family peptidase [Blautia sp. OF03-13]|uniref:U32 family peptidase n=1 Tax=Blautia sp. OF03-13 TaxID=2292980 RepID=UPI001FA82457|nr:U32 family peptidase [Blautia sp. OF03-13]
MKITAGLGSIDDYPRYVRAGADELFCGYVPFSWSEKYGTVLPLNRREVLNYNVQIGSFSELEILANMVQKYQKPVHLTFNSLYYRPEQYEEITQIIQQCRSIGFDSYILADPALLVYLRKEKIDCEVHLSGDLGTVNSAMTEVFAKEYPKRIIFQRKNTISEMRAVIRHITAQKEAARKEWTYPTEFEAFALNELCQFSGAFCNSLHCDEMGYLCRVPYWKKPMSFSESKLEKQEKNRPGENISISEWDSASELTNPVSEDGYLCGATGCGLCTLKRFPMPESLI